MQPELHCAHIQSKHQSQTHRAWPRGDADHFQPREARGNTQSTRSEAAAGGEVCFYCGSRLSLENQVDWWVTGVFQRAGRERSTVLRSDPWEPGGNRSTANANGRVHKKPLSALWICCLQLPHIPGVVVAVCSDTFVTLTQDTCRWNGVNHQVRITALLWFTHVFYPNLVNSASLKRLSGLMNWSRSSASFRRWILACGFRGRLV